jgi:hypothetical protein
MIHVYKHGGAWVRDGVNYHIKAINESELVAYLDDGWVTDRSLIRAPRQGSAFYRYEIKKIGKKPPPNASEATLKNLWEKLTDGTDT